jgi:hypothetical protein
MSCLINAGITRDCGFSFGGGKALYLLSKDQLTGVAKDSNGVITGITTVSAATFYDFQAEPNTLQLLQELQAGSPSRYVQATVNGSFANITQAKKKVLEDLANAYVVAIYQTQDNKYWAVGMESGRGLLASTLSIDTGAAEADAYVAALSLVGGALGYANEVLPAAVSAVVI